MYSKKSKEFQISNPNGLLHTTEVGGMIHRVNYLFVLINLFFANTDDEEGREVKYRGNILRGFP